MGNCFQLITCRTWKQFLKYTSLLNKTTAVSYSIPVSSYFPQNEPPVGIFIDLSKVFDTLDHTIFIQKLNQYGIADPPLTFLTLRQN